MYCAIYKSSKKDEMYMYIARPDYPDDQEKDPFAGIPEMLQQVFGRPVFVMHLELHIERKLARVSVSHVMDALTNKGYFVQMPPDGLINPNAVAPEGLRGA